MRGDVLNSIRWDEVNDCGTFQEWDKRKVKLYGKPIKDLEFNNEIEAEQRLYKYYRRTHKWRLLYEDEEEEETETDTRPKIYFNWKTSDVDFGWFRWHIESLIEHFSYPSLEEIERDNKFFVFFYKWISYVIRWDRILIKDEIKVNPKDYYPEDYKQWDPIPADTVNKMIAAKLGIDWKMFRDILNNNSDFYCNEDEELYKEKVFSSSQKDMPEKQDNNLHSLIETLKPWELLIITRTDDWWMFKWKGTKWIPNWKWKWVNNNWDTFGWEFVDWVANGEWYAKFSDWMEFKWVWENWVMKANWWKEKWTVTFHIEDLNFDNISEKLVVQRNEDWWLSVFENK